MIINLRLPLTKVFSDSYHCFLNQRLVHLPNNFFLFLELQNIVLALDALEGDMIPGKNLESFLGNIGIKSPEEEVEKILKSDFVSGKHLNITISFVCLFVRFG